MLFFIALVLAVFGSVYRFTTWPGTEISKNIALTSLLIVSFRFLAVLYSMPINKTIFVLLISPFVLYTSVKVYEHEYLLFPFLFCVSAWNVNFRTIVKVFFWINLILLFFTVLASLFGIIQNKVFTRDDFDIIEAVNTTEVRIRYCFGYHYPTDFAAHFTYLNIMWWYLRRGVFKWINYMPILFSIWFVDNYCNARTEVVVMILIILFSLYYKLRITKVSKIYLMENIYFRYSVPLMAIFMLFLEYQYMNSTNELYQILNIFFSGRLSITANAIMTKGITWFGQFYIQNGAGTKLEYNYIDCQYMIWLIIYGIFIFVLALYIFYLICRKSVQSKEYLIAIIISILSIENLIFPSLGLIKYNPFILALFSNITTSNEKSFFN